MKQALLDFLDRTLLVLLHAAGYGLAATCVGFGGYTLLFALGILRPAHPPEAWVEFLWVPWVLALCLLALAPCVVFIALRILPPIAARDPRERPALHAVVAFGGACLAFGALGFGVVLLLGLGSSRQSEIPEGLALVALGWLACHGANQLATNWPYHRPAERAPAPQAARILPPPDYRA